MYNLSQLTDGEKQQQALNYFRSEISHKAFGEISDAHGRVCDAINSLYLLGDDEETVALREALNRIGDDLFNVIRTKLEDFRKANM